MLKRFSSFSLDTGNQCIHRGGQRIQLAPKAYSVLSYLIENPGRIVTKEELLQAAWPDTFVQEAVLKTCILDIRKALGEDPKKPKCIETAHRRGYRFVDSMIAVQAPEDRRAPRIAVLAGRSADLKRLHSLLDEAVRGNRQIAFVTGEPGIGKSTLIDAFLEEAARAGPVRILKGQSIEHFGAREAYYPVFDALARGAKDGSFHELIGVLRRYAPTWLIQMPGITDPAGQDALKQDTLGASRDRMLREISEALEVLAAKNPLVMVLEDLHWSDVSTLDLISLIGNRTYAARLLLIASYRPVEAILSNHPVRSMKKSLLAQRKCVELDLELLSKSDIADFLALRFPNHSLPDHFAGLLHDRTSGNPLFVTNVVDYAVSRSLIAKAGGQWHLSSAPSDFDLQVPESLSKMIDTQFERLSAQEQAVLETASAAGVTFAIPVIAGSEPDEVGSMEACCDELARRQLFIRTKGVTETSLGLISAEYQFTHALYRDVIYKRLSPVRRIRVHQAIGERLEKQFEARLSEVASELALHFQESRDAGKAIRYLGLLAQRCAARHALREGVEALMRAINLADSLPEPGRSETEIDLRQQLGLMYRLMGNLGSSAAEFEKMFQRACEAGKTADQLRAQLWLASVASWLDRERCLKAVDTVLELCRPDVDSELRLNALGQVAYWNLLFRGWDERDASASAAALEAARRSGDRAGLALHANRHSFFQCLSSQYRDACRTAQEGVRIAIENESLLDYSIGLFFEAWGLLHLGDWGRMQSLVRSAIEMANRNGHELWALLFGLLEALLHVQAFSFSHARDMSQEYVQRARSLGHPLSIQMSLVILGLAELGADSLMAARQRFDEIREWQSREGILMDWIWKMPLQAGLVELSLAEGNLAAARAESRLLQTLASATAERTWTALAHFECACVAVAGQDHETAQHEIAKGLAVIEHCEAPLAAWRLHALAAEIHGGNDHRERAAATIRKLAGTLPQDDSLKQCVESSVRLHSPSTITLKQRKSFA